MGATVHCNIIAGVKLIKKERYILVTRYNEYTGQPYKHTTQGEYWEVDDTNIEFPLVHLINDGVIDELNNSERKLHVPDTSMYNTKFIGLTCEQTYESTVVDIRDLEEKVQIVKEFFYEMRHEYEYARTLIEHVEVHLVLYWG